MDKIARDKNILSSFISRYQKIVPNPLISAGLIGLGVFGVSKLGYRNIMDTVRSLGRFPGKQFSGYNDAQWDKAMDELTYDSKYSKWLPIGAGLLAAAAATVPHLSNYREYFGLTSWDSPIQPYQAHSFEPSYKRDINESAPIAMPKYGSYRMHKAASNLFEATGYDAGDLDMSKVINASSARDLFSNDPYLMNDSYTKNFGTAIINNASISTGVNNPTLGNILDSARDKISNKLTIQGIADIGMKSVIANQSAQLFTGVIDTMIGLSPTTRRNIIDTGTWAGTISAILN